MTTTAANEHDRNQACELLHGEEAFVFADADYRGAENRVELEHCEAEWFIANNPSKVKELKQHPRKNKGPLKLEYLKASLAS